MMDGNFCQHPIFLPEMAFWDLEMGHIPHIMFLKNFIYPGGGKLHMLVVGHAFYHIAYFFLHLIRDCDAVILF